MSSEMDGSYKKIESLYEDRVVKFLEQSEKLKLLVQKYSSGRLYSFSLALLCLILYFSYEKFYFFLGVLIGAIGFIIFLSRHIKSYKKLLVAQEMYEINEEALHRLHRNWKDIPMRDQEMVLPPCPYADDLDLFGKASLFQLLSTVGSSFGKKILAHWLTHLENKETILKRQKAVEELISGLDFRQTVYLSGRRVENLDGEPFLKWVEGEKYSSGNFVLKWLSKIIVLAMIFLLVVDFSGHLWGRLWVVLLMVNIILTITYARSVDMILNTLTDRGLAFSEYKSLIRAMKREDFQSEYLVELEKKFHSNGVQAIQKLRELKKLIWLIELRQSAVFYIPCQFLFLWDFHVLNRVEKWQETVGKQPRIWLHSIGEFESLCALATLAHDEPQWSFPEVLSGKEALFEAEELGHPLIQRTARVDNSISFSKKNPFSMITGSNMSGKTTLMRALGLNLVLARAGAPVYAKRMKTSLFTLRTSIRIRDSLELGISYFMAEVYKIKDVVESATKHATTPSSPLLFLLDEILHGTNSRERKIAALGIIQYLVSHKALGIVTTHDIEIANSEKIQEFTRHFHFQETIENAKEQKMSFDYTLRKGIATTSNALKLIRMVGIPLKEEEE